MLSVEWFGLDSFPKMRDLRSVVVKNALANVVRGLASGVVALVLPHFLTRWLDHDRFAVWVLLLQVAAFGSYIDSGMQITLARFFAQAHERNEVTGQDKLVSTALALLSVAGLMSLALVLLEISATVWVFPQLPATLVSEFRLALLTMAGTAAISLPLSAFAGVLIGLHRNELLAVTVGGSRITGAIAVLLVAPHTHSLVALSVCVAGPNLLGSAAHVVFAYHVLPSLRVHPDNASWAVGKQLLRFSAALMTWSIAGILVSGLDLTVLGHFDFRAVGFYSVSAYLVTFLAGVNASVSGALMTPIAALHARGDMARIRAVTLRVTRASTYFNVGLTVAALLWGSRLLQLWVGWPYAGPGTSVLYILMVANVIRLIPGPYASMLIATDQQKHGIAQGVAEGLTNLLTSLLLVVWFGAVGVAMGTLIGALVGVGWTWMYTFRRARKVPFVRRALLVEGAMRPMACLLPLILLRPALAFLTGTGASTITCIAAGATSAWLLICYGHVHTNSRVTEALRT